MTFPPIPVPEFEDAAFNELGAGSEARARNGADAPAAKTETLQVAALSRPQNFPHQRMDARAVDRDVAATHQAPAGRLPSARPGKSSNSEAATGRTATASITRGSSPVKFLTLEMSPVAFTVGIWGLYALMAFTAWRAVT